MMVKQQTLLDNENERINALNSYNILDTIPEKEYDAITRLASYICQTPIALITLIHGDRQWFKSKVGTDITELPRGDAFCNHTILNDEILEVSDMLNSDTFKDHNFVKNEPHMRFYAGAPLVDPNGFRIGSLCVMDQVPRTLSSEQRDALKTLADEVMSHFILRKQKKELEENLLKREEFFNLFNNSHEINCITDHEFKIELINEAVQVTLGYEPADVIGLPIYNFFTEESKKQFYILLNKAIETNEHVSELETEIIDKNGGTRWICWSVSLSNQKWYANGRDLTEQKQIAVKMEQLSLVASNVDNGVVISDKDDEVIWVNDAFEKITGFNITDVEGKFLGNVLKGKLTKDFTDERMVELLVNNKPYQVDFLITRKDGQPMWISVMKSVIKDEKDEVTKQIRIVTDITARKKAEQEIEILSFAARKSPTGILIRDREGNVIWMNEALENIFGYSLDEMKGHRFGSMLVGEETDQGVFKNAVEAAETNKSYEIELLIYKKDKTKAWVFVSNSPFYNEQGIIEHQIGVVVDITERKKSEEKLTTLSLVASSTTSGVVINNSEGKVEWVSNAFEKITGYTLRDTLNKPLGDVLKGEMTDMSVIHKSRELSKNKQSFEVDLLTYRKDGRPIWLSIINSVVVNSSGEIDKYIEVVIDITDKKKVEFELFAAKEEAMQLNRAKDMFISVMSHEIRTPLNAVIGISHLLQEENPLEAQKENLEILKFSADNLMHLINNVLDLTKIETGNIDLESTSINLKDLVQGVISSIQYKANDKRIYLKSNFDTNVPEMIIGDRTRLYQILVNLVGNSVKFTETGGITINIQVLRQTKDDVSIRFAVIDTGIGIAHDKIDTIFESFKQAEADTTRKYGGTGLGLAITKKLIELHDSNINVDSAPGQGSTFWFTINFKKGEIPAGKSENKMGTELQLTVLVVDDNQINRLLINKVLGKWGVVIEFAENGLEAVQKVEANNNFDVVLMDINMPVMGGLEATQIIRAKNEPYYKQLPIVALTASMLSTEIDGINKAGMNDYILKPFDPKVLFDKLSAYQKVD